MPPYKILVPLDGSRLAEHSLNYVRRLAELGDPEVELLSVVDETQELHDLSDFEARAREQNVLATYLREVASDFTKYVGIPAERKVAIGLPADSIIKEAQEFEPDVLIIATHGRSGFSRWRFGSVADKVIRGSACNTLVIGPKATERERWFEGDVEPPFRSILVPLDGSRMADQALPVARQFTEKFNSALHFVRVVSLPVIGAESANIVEMLLAAAKDHLTDVAEREHAPGGVKAEVLMGAAADALEEYIGNNNIDLVVMTSHGRSGIARTALGSVTDRILGGGKAPVLVVRPKESQ